MTLSLITMNSMNIINLSHNVKIYTCIVKNQMIQQQIHSIFHEIQDKTYCLFIDWKINLQLELSKTAAFIIYTFGILHYSEKQYIMIIIERRMSQELVVTLFDESTQMYEAGNYVGSLAMLNDCIYLQPQRSIFYSNRAISLYGMRELDRALQNLQNSISINHLNYISYFNLFSIHILHNQLESAFHNLCFSLSSAYVLASRKTINIDWINQSLFYSFNNKQSIFLKAIFSLQKQQFQNAINLFKHAHHLQNQQQNKDRIAQILFNIGSSIDEQDCFQLSDKFVLKTKLQCPPAQCFEKNIDTMLQQFNFLNKFLHEQQEIQYNSGKSLTISDKQQKQTNCITVHGSTLDNPSSNQLKYITKAQEGQAKEDLLEKLNLYSTISSGKPDQQQQYISKIKGYDLYCQGNKKRNFSVYLQCAKFYTFFDSSQISSMYIILNYKNDADQINIKTSEMKIENNLYRLAQKFQDIQLSQNPSQLQLKIYVAGEQGYQQDMLIGSGSLMIDSMGFFEISIVNSEKQEIGLLQALIERQNDC